MSEKKLPETERRPLVTVLCGFLGAGKTTVLNHLLRQAEGRRWAAVVNDVAAINIDVEQVRAESPGGDVVGLGNGCVCCTSRDDLAEAIARLSREGDYGHILVETTGVAEPRGIANLFTRRNPFGRSLGDFARLSALVSVVDAAQFLHEWKGRQAGGRPVAAGEGMRQPVFELMVEQVECADVIILNKCDLLDEPGLRCVENIIKGLNERAELVRTEHGQVSSEYLLERIRFDPSETPGAARWLRVLNALPAGGGVAPAGTCQVKAGAPARHEERYGISSWVFQARKPFVQGRFEALLERGVPGLLRAKGYFWLAERPDELGFLSVAGGIVRTEFPGYWWAAMIESGRARREEVPEVLERLWKEPGGDRRQELVFIGVGLDEQALRRGLEDCMA